MKNDAIYICQSKIHSQLLLEHRIDAECREYLVQGRLGSLMFFPERYFLSEL